MDWQPTSATRSANLVEVMTSLQIDSIASLHRWSVEHRDAFWNLMIGRLGIRFRVPPHATSTGPAQATRWLPGAELNIAESCFQADDDSVAVIYETAAGSISLSTAELRAAVQACAGGLAALGVRPGTRVAMAMPMTVESIVGYLGVVWAGGTVVSIADSFASPEIESRLAIADCSIAITQDVIERGSKRLPMYEKLIDAQVGRCIVVETGAGMSLRAQDIAWSNMMAADPLIEPVIRSADAYTNVLFSSGTTGDPKAIPWDQTPPIKAATDGHLHQDIGAGDVVSWPTNLGWMMGPWLIYASLLNRATIALSSQVPTSLEFCQFITTAGVNVLGVVPALVRSWRTDERIGRLDWSSVRVVSSTGEASVPEDMRWLMTLTKSPVIEYCGGTEIGGGYLSSTVIEAFDASTFTTPCFGLDLRLLDDSGSECDEGEVFIVPPSIGLSTELLNRDHQKAYYVGLPDSDVPLRRHGDQLRRLASGHWRAMGRSDDTMNLGGIKVSSADIERAVNVVAGVVEAAAVGVPPDDGGPDRLVIFAVAPGQVADDLAPLMQNEIKATINPLFKIDQVVVVDSLPRTASAKVMRRSLRASL